MKKIYLSILGIAALSSGFAQIAGKREERSLIFQKEVKTTVAKSTSKKESVEKSVGTVIKSYDFTNAGDWTLASASGNSLPGSGWNINSTVESEVNKISSTSGGNFAEMWNGPSTGTNHGVTHTMTTAAPISINTNQLLLTFEQYGALFNDLQEFYVSTNGSTWTKVGSNSDKVVNVAFSNPDYVKINLSSAVSANATQLWIRFQWTSAFPSSTTELAWFTYGWMIDDVAISNLSDNDLSVKSVSVVAGNYKMSYAQIPLTQLSPITFSANVINSGKNTQAASVLTGTITGAASASILASTPVSLASADTTFLLSDTYTPTVTGTYNFTVTAAAGSPDDVNSDNTASGSFKVTSGLYSVDNGVSSGSISNLSSNTGNPLKIGNTMEILVDDKIDAMSINLSSASTNVGQAFHGEIWKLNTDTGDFEKVGETAPAIITAGMNNKANKLAVVPYVPVLAGDLIIAFACHDGGANPVEFKLAQQLTNPVYYDPIDATVAMPSVWYLKNSDLWSDARYSLSISDALMTGVYMNSKASITENNEVLTSIGSIFPNPTTGSATISYNLENASPVTVKVMDITGKVVYSSNEGTKLEGAHKLTVDAAAFNTGVYYVTVSTNNTQLTQKLIKK